MLATQIRYRASSSRAEVLGSSAMITIDYANLNNRGKGKQISRYKLTPKKLITQAKLLLKMFQPASIP